MMGRQSSVQDRLFYSFNLDARCPETISCEGSTATSIWANCTSNLRRSTATQGVLRSIRS